MIPILIAAASLCPAQDVTSPEEHLGRPVGVDFELADWDEVRTYYDKLAAESPHVKVERVGTSTEGRDFLLATITSEANMARLDDIKLRSAQIADPRGLSDADKRAAVGEGVPILMMSLAMHSTETGGTQFGMEFAWLLATSNEEPYRSARENMVVLVVPCTNPDGLDHVVHWYRETVGTPHEAASLTKLYQYYSGHDNNRDWFMLSQAETRIVSELLYSVWHPHVYWDVHQQGSRRERIFVPPFRDPLNPNLDPAVMAGIGALGSRALLDMTREGFTGISTGVSYDMWWNGGNRNVPVRHNIIGLLTEAASVNLASPIWLPLRELSGPSGLDGYAPSNQFPAPWPGGWWRLRDILDYEQAFGRSLLRSIAREPEVWLQSAMDVAERAIAAAETDTPIAWVLPATNADPGAVRRLVDSLLRTGVEIERARGPVRADGRTYPAGSVVIRRAQPYGTHVKDLLEVQRYPDGKPPYDVAGWTLPFLLGVHRVEVIEEFEADTEPIDDPAEAIAQFPAASDGVQHALESDAWRWAFAELVASRPVSLAVSGESAGRFQAGAGDAEDDSTLTIDGLPRIGVYAPWSGSMDEGWMRYALDTFGLPYLRVRNEMLRAGRLSDFLDVLVVPSISSGQLDRGRTPGSIPARFARGLDPEGAVAVEDFVRTGGKLVAVGSSAGWAIELFDLPVSDVTRDAGSGDFSCPGSVLRAVPEESPWTAGLPASMAIFFSRSAAFAVEDGANDDDVEVLLRYAPTRTLLSGWIRSPEVIAGEGAWLRVPHGEGSVHLFGFRPQYRGWSQASFHLLFRAALLDG